MKDVTVITLKKNNIRDFAYERNHELSKVKTEWAFFCDDDETMSDELQKEIEQVVKKGGFDAYKVKRVDVFLGRELRYGETGHTHLVRLARKGAGKWKRPVHEVWEINGTVGELKSPLFHHAHKSIHSFLTKIDKYSSMEAEYRQSRDTRSSLWHIAVYPVGKFIKNYVLLQGFRDGIPGLIMAIMMSFHSFLTWSKLYILWRKE